MPINREGLEKAILEAYRQTAMRMDLAFKAEISAVKWEWPRGETPRDIVDTGRLRASQQMMPAPAAKGSIRTMYQWPVKYAAPVHEGAVFQSGAFMPARPWTRTALQKLQPQSFFEKALAREIGKLGNGGANNA